MGSNGVWRQIYLFSLLHDGYDHSYYSVTTSHDTWSMQFNNDTSESDDYFNLTRSGG